MEPGDSSFTDVSPSLFTQKPSGQEIGLGRCPTSHESQAERMIHSLSRWLLLGLIPFTAFSATVPWLTVSDTINPGTADFIAQTIEMAELEKAPFVVLQMNTPGGLLTSTRQIVQSMMNAKIPVVVYVGPQGAQAGSAGALICFAADVIAMANGTNIGAAHPVTGGGETMDKTMSEKVTNDTAAFAESLAKTKARNAVWAIKSVRESASLPAIDALKDNVIDLIADSPEQLLGALKGFRFRVKKGEMTGLAHDVFTLREITPSIKHRVVSFLANPSLAYLIMSLGGLCLWIELSHPGLMFPGVLGAFCIIFSLVSFQLLPISYGALALIFLGMGLLAAELFVPSFGVLGVGGIAAFVFGSLFLMDTEAPEFQISLALILPLAAGLAATAFGLGYLVLKSQKTKVQSGIETLVGQLAEVVETISPHHGKVFVNGEIWLAKSLGESPIPKGSIVVVSRIEGMVVIVVPKPGG